MPASQPRPLRSSRFSTFFTAMFISLILAASHSSLAQPRFDAPPPAPSPSPQHPLTFDHVIIISIDGLRSDALICAPNGDLPNLRDLIAEGSSTLNARTDPNSTVTLPNHTGMLTGLPMNSPPEFAHHWEENSDPPAGVTLHDRAGRYIPGLFDVAHDHGLAVALYAGKSKFSLFRTSWDDLHGALDATPPDNGCGKIDNYFYTDDPAAMTDRALFFLTAHAARRSLVFLHFGGTDKAGHDHGWDLTPGSEYLKALSVVDTQIGRVLNTIHGSADLAHSTAVIVTTDHGGGVPFTHHNRIDAWSNYIIPFIVWIGPPSDHENLTTGDLYELNPTSRRDPSLSIGSVEFDSNHNLSSQPVRNADAANLALDLLNLPPIPGSLFNVHHDLRVYRTISPTSPAHAPDDKSAPTSPASVR